MRSWVRVRCNGKTCLDPNARPPLTSSEGGRASRKFCVALPRRATRLPPPPGDGKRVGWTGAAHPLSRTHPPHPQPVPHQHPPPAAASAWYRPPATPAKRAGGRRPRTRRVAAVPPASGSPPAAAALFIVRVPPRRGARGGLPPGPPLGSSVAAGLSRLAGATAVPVIRRRAAPRATAAAAAASVVKVVRGGHLVRVVATVSSGKARVARRLGDASCQRTA